MSAQVNIFLLLFGGLQGLLLSLLLFKKKAFRTGYLFLIGYLLVMILQITLKVMSKMWLTGNMMPLYALSYQLPFLYGPFVYLFVRQVIGQRSVILRDLIHFMPVIAVIIHLVFDDAYHYTPSLLIPLFDLKSRLVLQLVSLASYHAAAMYYWYSYQKDLKNKFSDLQKIRLGWLKKFIYGSFIVCMLIAVVIYLMYLWFPHHQDVRFGFVALTIFIYWISFSAWNQPEIFSVIRGFANEPVQAGIPKLIVHRSAKKYSNSGLSEGVIKKIIARLETIIQKNKLFLEADLTIDKLASDIPCSKHHLSQVLNDVLDKSFYDYINHYRVEEARQLLIDPGKAGYKISSIAYDAGFNSVSTFNEVFRKFTGLTPSQFRKKPSQQARQQRV